VGDPRVVRTRAAVVDAARALFLQQGYAGTTMEQIAARAGLTKRTVYNNYGDKDALFTQIVADVLSYAETFTRRLHEEFDDSVTAASLRQALDDLAQRLALGIVRPEVLAIRCLLIGEARNFPTLGSEYFDRAPGQVLDALASRFADLSRRRLLRVPDARRAAEQFAYLVVGAALDRALLTGAMPSNEQITEAASDGVETFLARYKPRRRARRS
jgi:TetR/AcrR family transcriptional regulator, mexJK operon transcriptional repressor